MFDGVGAVDESIVRVTSVAVRGGSGVGSDRASGSVSFYIAVRSVDEEVIWTDRMGGQIPIQVDWNVVQLGRMT